ncbi:MAG: hypothetical protein LBU99_01620 [Spirochaetaceae bacterium]|jgi:AAA15 family ATPase/GTPase|nr:hypothetical protein [Spirochaetaceae bacterium]
MDIAALLKIAEQWGPSGIVTSVLIFAIVHLSRKLTANEKKDSDRAKQTEKLITDAIKEIEEKLSKRLDEHDRRLSIIELEYTKNSDFLRELSGWRFEIHRLSDLITKQFSDFMKSIIDVWKEKDR